MEAPGESSSLINEVLVRENVEIGTRHPPQQLAKQPFACLDFIWSEFVWRFNYKLRVAPRELSPFAKQRMRVK